MIKNRVIGFACIVVIIAVSPFAILFSMIAATCKWLCLLCMAIVFTATGKKIDGNKIKNILEFLE